MGVILNISAYGRWNETKTQEMIYEPIVIRPPHPRVDMSRVLVKLYPRASLELRWHTERRNIEWACIVMLNENKFFLNPISYGWGGGEGGGAKMPYPCIF